METIIQIPIYRAKKIDSDEYVIGYYNLTYNNKHILATPWIEIIDPSTMSIHFPDMIALNSDRILPSGDKDLRIFASLSEDGKGGDMLTFEKDEPSTVCKIENGQPIYRSGNVILAKKYLHLKITGIQQ